MPCHLSSHLRTWAQSQHLRNYAAWAPRCEQGAANEAVAIEAKVCLRLNPDFKPMPKTQRPMPQKPIPNSPSFPNPTSASRTTVPPANSRPAEPFDLPTHLPSTPPPSIPRLASSMARVDSQLCRPQLRVTEISGRRARSSCRNSSSPQGKRGPARGRRDGTPSSKEPTSRGASFIQRVEGFIHGRTKEPPSLLHRAIQKGGSRALWAKMKINPKANCVI